MLKLNLPEFDYVLKKEDGKLRIFDQWRKKYLVLTPEEWVRQHFLHFLVSEKQVSPTLMRIEGGLDYNKLNKRTDILVYNRRMQPFLLVECKASYVTLNQEVINQLATYNSKLKLPLLAVTNGLTHHYYKKKGSAYQPITDLPVFPDWK